MAYGFGQGIQAGLGAIDYSTIARGGQMAAQGVMQGAQSMAQGIAALGQGVGMGIQQYNKKQEEKKQKEQAVGMLGEMLKSNPQIAKQMGVQIDPSGEFDKAQLAAGVDAVGGPVPFMQMGSELMKFQQQQAQQEEARRAAMEQASRAQLVKSEANKVALGGQPAGMLAPEIRNEALLQGMIQRAQLGKLNLEATPKQPDLSVEEQAIQARVAAFEAQNGRKPNALEMPALFSEAAAERRPVTNINPGPNVESAETAKLKVSRNEKIFTSAEEGVGVMRRAKNVAELVSSGDVNVGVLSPITQGIDRLLAEFPGGQEAAKRASKTQLAESFMASEVFAMIQQLGLGSRNFDTPAEREFIVKAMTGDRTMLREAIVGLAKARFDEAKRNVEKYNNQVNNVKGYNKWVQDYNNGEVPTFEVTDWISDSPSGSAAPKPAQSPVGAGKDLGDGFFLN